MEEYKMIKLKQLPCELCKLLKLHDLVQTGGHAKFEISEGKIKVNDQVETRKAKKIVAGDIIEYANNKYKIII